MISQDRDPLNREKIRKCEQSSVATGQEENGPGNVVKVKVVLWHCSPFNNSGIGTSNKMCALGSKDFHEGPNEREKSHVKKTFD